MQYRLISRKLGKAVNVLVKDFKEPYNTCCFVSGTIQVLLVWLIHYARPFAIIYQNPHDMNILNSKEAQII